MTTMDDFMNSLRKWAHDQEDISSMALVGSWARARATEDSDIDLILIVVNPESYLNNDDWISVFGQVERIAREDWGLVQTKRVFFANGIEVEFNFTKREWASISPIDPGTQKVVTDGMQILYDKDQLLHLLREAIQGFDRKKLD